MINNKESNLEILDIIKNYIEVGDTGVHLRFGQILANLNINEFANKQYPELENFKLRDIYNDSNDIILKRIKK